MSETKRLGRGLEALLGPISREQAEASGAFRELAVGTVRPNPYQPRTHMDEEALSELTASIEASGLLQPIVVRPKSGSYELIAGERRWRAVQRLGWEKVPAVIKDVDDQTLLTLALIENLQRNNLSAIDEAVGYRRLMEEFTVPQAEVARLVGRNRSTVANLLRLLKLPQAVQALVHEGKLTEGHARALLALEDDARIVEMAQQAVAEQWSVRETEERVRGGGMVEAPAAAEPVAPTKPPAKRREQRMLPPDARRVEDVLRKRLGTDVKLSPRRRGRGFLTIKYYSNDDLARVLELILGEPYAG
ncbi:MAG TPA: ParB/RepB/Spo0J family partition protein [Gemmatimonadales bacterium]|nr:ParB/RepB/Spo0J family partition protein [Gemmatimonadales bacterium]